MEYPKITGMALHDGKYINPQHVIDIHLIPKGTKVHTYTYDKDVLRITTIGLEPNFGGNSSRSDCIELKFESPEHATEFLKAFDLAKREALGMVEKTGPDRFIGSNSGMGAGR
jgi:hypothetical protein